MNELTINEELGHKNIIYFKSSDYHVMVRIIDGKAYCWGWNNGGLLGYGKNDLEIYKRIDK